MFGNFPLDCGADLARNFPSSIRVETFNIAFDPVEPVKHVHHVRTFDTYHVTKYGLIVYKLLAKRANTKKLQKAPLRATLYHKGCLSILTAGRWSWKLKPAKECVITHLSNRVALKMDGAEACCRCQTIVVYTNA